jgi:hypothetical protein
MKLSTHMPGYAVKTFMPGNYIFSEGGKKSVKKIASFPNLGLSVYGYWLNTQYSR